MIVSVHQPQYIPWLGFFDKIAKSDCFVFLDNVQYKEREFQNRNKIRTSNGVIWLSVPVITKDKARQRIKEVLIDNTQPWQRKHWNALVSAYGKAKFFRQYSSFFENVYKTQWQYLWQLNVEIIKYILHCLNINTVIKFESELNTTTTKTARIIEICKKLAADTYLSGAGGKDYLEEELFSQNQIKLIYQEYKHPHYRQMFMKNEDDFIANLSVIDLLFNEGPRSKDILLG
ncbi:MAG: WbqC family protein [Candidatus Omnitrophica bacterium]|nr:WbqC family protein [Candidatus Omnitrophota bacterium]